jgi:hypothetical protein
MPPAEPNPQKNTPTSKPREALTVQPLRLSDAELNAFLAAARPYIPHIPTDLLDYLKVTLRLPL